MGLLDNANWNDPVLAMAAGLLGAPSLGQGLSRGLLGKRRERIGAEVCDLALESLSVPLDHDTVAAWMARFLAG